MQEQQKANWIARREIVEKQSVTGFVYISDKGALKFVSVDGNGQERFLFCIMPQHLPYLNNFDTKALAESEDYKNIREGAIKAREKAKVEQKVQKEIERQALKAQAALEQLARLGVDTTKLVKAG